MINIFRRHKKLNKIVIIYQSEKNVSVEVASKMKLILEEQYKFDIELKDIDKNHIPKLSTYDFIIIGSDSDLSQWAQISKELLDEASQESNIASFYCTAKVGETRKDIEGYKAHVESTLKTYLPLDLVDTAVFGSKISINKELIIENIDWGEVINWTIRIGKIFSNIKDEKE